MTYVQRHSSKFGISKKKKKNPRIIKQLQSFSESWFLSFIFKEESPPSGPNLGSMAGHIKMTHPHEDAIDLIDFILNFPRF